VKLIYNQTTLFSTALTEGRQLLQLCSWLVQC